MAFLLTQVEYLTLRKYLSKEFSILLKSLDYSIERMYVGKERAILVRARKKFAGVR